ncbi:MAG: glycosyltransferase [Flavipsychrobacter sp.]|nr:glycosyltransferase [Flavipsychrobacter sp.]
MQKHKIHIISFDIPYPPDYGGAIDVYYKVKALHDAGAEIYLHCFAYGRQPGDMLEKLFKQVWYYPRKKGIAGLSPYLPYIVYSRRGDELLQRLIDIDAPILFEGIHSTYYINHPKLSDRIKAVRAHNIEGEYYKQLANKEPNLLKRIYYHTEAALAKRYEHSLTNANVWMPLSMADEEYFRKIYPNAEHQFIAPFHPYNNIESIAGNGNYCLYHGNLSHPENIEAALFLIEVFNDINIPFTIAGRNPSQSIINACKANNYCTLIANPDQTVMQQLISDAHIHVLPTFQESGMKLKLLYALFNGRHILVNKQMLYGTGLDELCTIATTVADFKSMITQLMQKTFSPADIEKRTFLLKKHYNNTDNAAKILTLLQG